MHMKLKQWLNLTSSGRSLQSLKKCASRSRPKFYEFACVPGLGLQITVLKKKTPHWLVCFFSKWKNKLKNIMIVPGELKLHITIVFANDMICPFISD